MPNLHPFKSMRTGILTALERHAMSPILRFLIALLILTPAIRSQTFGPNIRINDDPAGSNQRAPVLRIGPDGILYAAWIDYRSNSGGDIYFSKSSDGGKTFSRNVPVSTGGSVNANFQRTAYFAADSRGGLHFVWLETRIGNQPDIYYARSTDGGAAFSAPISLSADSSKYAQDFPSIAIDGADNIYVCFLDSREVQSGRSTNVQLYFTRSTDGGSTFSTPVRISNMPFGEGGTCECCRTDIAATRDGHLYAAFRSNINNRRDIFIARSRDKGASFDSAIPVPSESWYIGACPVTGPSIALDSEENAHVAWIDARASAGGSSYVYYGMLPAGAWACLPDMRLSDAQRSGNYPDIKITPDGMILCAYQESRTDPMDLFYLVSTNGGNTFSRSRKLTDETVSTRQEFVSCAVDRNGVRYAVWQDARRDAGDIYFSKDTTALIPEAPGTVRIVAPADGSTISAFSSFVWRKPANLGKALRVKYELAWQKSGEQPVTLTTFDTTAFPLLLPGSYVWHVQARTLAGSSAGADTARFTLGAPAVVTEKGADPSKPTLEIFPNPLRSGGEIRFGMPRSGSVHISILDLLGREARVITSGYFSAGFHSMRFDRGALAEGLYFYRMRTQEGMVFLRVILRR